MKKRFKKAFSMLELVFAIVVLGIVSSVGADIIANTYRSYVLQRAQHSASIKSELAMLEIANRLRYAIEGTIFRVKNDDSFEAIDLPLGSSGEDYKGLQWVAYDGDSFETSNTPGWTGMCDVAPSTKRKLVTPGSDLDLTDSVIQNLSSGSRSISDAVVYFPHGSGAYPIDKDSDGNISFDSDSDMVEEHYKLAWSSYALILEDADGDGVANDLFLYYNFSPVPQATRGDIKKLLLKNITTFKFKGTDGVIRIKLCKEESIGESDKNITSCKEKAVF